MIYQSTKLIQQTFLEHNINCQAVERGELSVVLAGFNGKNAKNVMVHFISRSDANDIAVRILALASAPEDKRSTVLAFLNETNARFRFVKLVLTRTGEINLDCDVPSKVANVGEVCMELFIRLIQITDELYPQLMKAIWSDPAVPTIKN